MSQNTQRSFAAESAAARRRSLRATSSRHDRQRDQLRVRVLERRAGGRAVVLEDQDVAEAGCPASGRARARGTPTAPARSPAPPSSPASCRDRGVSMITSCAPMPFIRSNSPSPSRSSVALDLQRRKLVRHDAQVPAGRVRRAAVCRYASTSGGVMSSWPGQNGQSSSPMIVTRLEAEVVGALLALGRDDDPAAGDGIFSQVGHELSLQRLHIKGASHQFYRVRALLFDDRDHVEPARHGGQPLDAQV